MQIDLTLKRNLIADVENICCVALSEDDKESLMRCFEITIGTHLKQLNLESKYTTSIEESVMIKQPKIRGPPPG